MTLKEIKFKRGYGVGFQSTLTSKEKLRHMREKKHNPHGGQLFIVNVFTSGRMPHKQTLSQHSCEFHFSVL